MKAERVAKLDEQDIDANGFARCGRCGQRVWIYPNTSPSAVRSIVSGFTKEHGHGSVTVVTPHGNTRAPIVPRSTRCSRCRGQGHNARTCTAPVGVIPEEVPCSWCGAASTTTDEDGDPACAQHASEVVRPEAFR